MSTTQKRPSADVSAFRKKLNSAKHVVVVTGFGISAASGIPQICGDGGFWRKFQEQDLSSHVAFMDNSSLVWEFYHHKRDAVLKKKPNKAHVALAELEQKFAKENRKFIICTQNIDELHQRAGSKNVIELHGTIFKTWCMQCKQVVPNNENPISEGLRGRGCPDAKDVTDIPNNLLPRCKKAGCSNLLWPYNVWASDSLKQKNIEATFAEIEKCDFLITVGTSAFSYPAALFAPELVERNVPIAEFNVEPTPNTGPSSFYFEGCCTKTLPHALGL